MRLIGIHLIIGEKKLGMLETILYQCCTLHSYTNIFSITPRNKMKAVVLMLKSIVTHENKESTREKAMPIAERLIAMKLAKIAKKVTDVILSDVGIEKKA